ncbi:transglutaminase family protein [Actinomadura alba]|uniref:transglutaminase-like domain-containing protein n=1 Tax=Actinomadura alba TaxID=406431 RepID=UPI0031D0E223
MAAKYLFVTPTSERVEDYYDADEVIDFEHPAIEALADRLQRRFGDSHDQYDEVGDIGFAQAAFTFVRDGIAHSADVDDYSAAYRASDVLRLRNAICFGKAHLLTALLRARDIATGLCYQRIADAGSRDGFVLHGLGATRLSGRWSRLDPRGNKPGVDAQFELYDERLAWTVDPAQGEIDYPYVHPSPPPGLLAALRAARPGPDAYAHLPTGLA